MRPPVVFAFPPAKPALLASDVFYFQWVWYDTRDWTRSFWALTLSHASHGLASPSCRGFSCQWYALFSVIMDYSTHEDFHNSSSKCSYTSARWSWTSRTFHCHFRLYMHSHTQNPFSAEDCAFLFFWYVLFLVIMDYRTHEDCIYISSFKSCYTSAR